MSSRWNFIQGITDLFFGGSSSSNDSSSNNSDSG